MIEKAGIPTVSITLLREVTEKVKPPRALFVDRSFGYPLGQPNDRSLQREIIQSALGLLNEARKLPILAAFEEKSPDSPTTLSCRDVARTIASDGLLGARGLQWVDVQLHLLLCRGCRRYAAQQRAIGEATSRLWGNRSDG